MVKWLLDTGAISIENRALYEYGIYTFLFNLAPILLVIGIGICFGMVLESILMIIPFMLIRKFCGGFHLKSSVACFFSSTAVLALFLLGIRWTLRHDQLMIFGILTFLSAVSIIVFSPIDSKERRLTEKERIVFKKTAIAIAVIIALLSGLLALSGHLRSAVSMGNSLILAAALQIPCFFLRKARRDRPERRE